MMWLWVRRAAIVVGAGLAAWGLVSVVVTVAILGRGDAMVTLLLLLVCALASLVVVVPMSMWAWPRAREVVRAHYSLARRRRRGARMRRHMERERVERARRAGPLRVESHRVPEIDH